MKVTVHHTFEPDDDTLDSEGDFFGWDHTDALKELLDGKELRIKLHVGGTVKGYLDTVRSGPYYLYINALKEERTGSIYVATWKVKVAQIESVIAR